MRTLAEYTVGFLDVKIVFDDSEVSNNPGMNHISFELPAPDGYRIVGGGARVEPVDPTIGALLTAMYPSSDGSVWHGKSKDHSALCAHSLTLYAVCVKSQRGPISDRDYIVVENESGVESHPSISATIPEEFSMVGGGARSNYPGIIGQLLISSYPSSSSQWLAGSKDHSASAPSTITSFAIGLRSSFLKDHGVKLLAPVSASSVRASHPHATLNFTGASLLSGGAKVDYSPIGNLLTASYPTGQTGWNVDAKDHSAVDPEIATAYAIAATPL